MMPEIRTIDAKPYHCGKMTRRLRREHKAAIRSVGWSAGHRAMRHTFDASSSCKAWLVDNELMALMGTVGSPLSSSVIVWMAVTEEAARRFPILMFKQARLELDRLLASRPTIYGTTVDADVTSARFVRALGFVELSRSGGISMWVLRREMRKVA